MSGRAGHLQQTIRQGEELVANRHFGADKIQERIEDIQVLRVFGRPPLTGFLVNSSLLPLL